MRTELPPVNWVELQGTVNVRDLGGLRTTDGSTTRPGVLLRSAHLQHLTTEDVRILREEFDVRSVVDLRTEAEVGSEGPGPLHAEPDVVVYHLSLYPDGTTFARIGSDPSVVTVAASSQVGLLNEPEDRSVDGRPAFVEHYLRYLQCRPDSILTALRAVSEPGATIVHCAAGKDRTGVVVALMLAAVGVAPELIAADYAATELRLDAIAAHLRRNAIYAGAMSKSERIPVPSAQVMLAVLAAIDEDFGGVSGWLSSQGFTAQDQGRLSAALVETPRS